MASDTAAWFDERRSWGIVSAIAAGVVATMSLLDLDDVHARDIVIIGAAVGVYHVHELRLLLREPLVLAFVFAFPMITVLVLGGVFDDDVRRSRVRCPATTTSPPTSVS